MSIVIPTDLETKLRANAQAEGLSIEAYIERLVTADEKAEEELTILALEALKSGDPLKVGPDYWEENIADSTNV